MQERAPLMVLEPVRLDRPERRAPRRDGGEAVECPVGDRPLVEHDRRPGVTPGDPARGDRTTAPADVLADREVHVVPGDPLDPPLVPELREPGVDVDERGPPKPAADDVRAHVAADVDEQVAPCGRVGVGVLEPEAFGGGARVVEVRWSRVVRLLDQAHPTAEPAEAERVAQPHPGLAAVPGLARERAGDRDRPSSALLGQGPRAVHRSNAAGL